MTSLLRTQWDEICARVRAKEDPFFHDPWLDRIAFLHSDGGKVTLATPNRLYVDFIRENLEPRLMRHLHDITDRG